MPVSSNSDDNDDLSFQLGTKIDSLRKIPLRTGIVLAISLASSLLIMIFQITRIYLQS